MATMAQSYTFRDARGFTGTVKVWIHQTGVPANDRSVGSALAPLLAALSNANLESARGPYTTPASAVGYGTQADYGSIEDKAVLSFEDTAGGLHRMKIPAPKAGIFLTDGMTVDNGNTDVAALITDVIAELVTKEGLAFIGMPAGLRTRVRTRRKMSIWTLNPAETGPDE